MCLALEPLPGGHLLALMGGDLHLYNTKDASAVAGTRTLICQGVTAVCPCPATSRFITARSTDSLEVWDLNPKLAVAQTVHLLSGTVTTHMCLLTGGSMVSASRFTGNVTFWSTSPDLAQQRTIKTRGGVRALLALPQNRLACLLKSGLTRILDGETGNCLQTLMTGVQDLPHDGLGNGPNGSILATCTTPGQEGVCVWRQDPPDPHAPPGSEASGLWRPCPLAHLRQLKAVATFGDGRVVFCGQPPPQRRGSAAVPAGSGSALVISGPSMAPAHLLSLTRPVADITHVRLLDNGIIAYLARQTVQKTIVDPSKEPEMALESELHLLCLDTGETGLRLGRERSSWLS